MLGHQSGEHLNDDNDDDDDDDDEVSCAESALTPLNLS